MRNCSDPLSEMWSVEEMLNDLIWVSDDEPEETLDDLIARGAELEEEYIMEYDQFYEVVTV